MKKKIYNINFVSYNKKKLFFLCDVWNAADIPQ